jgi:hypothetical protein
MKIIKAKETMSAKERVRKTFAHEKTDRVTIGYETNDGIHRRLKEALGMGETDAAYFGNNDGRLRLSFRADTSDSGQYPGRKRGCHVSGSPRF